MTTQRTDWVDYAKGIGIILVVYAHLLSSAFNAGIAIPHKFFLLSDSAVYSFHMPLFFFLSGLFVSESYEKRGMWPFCKNKIILLAYPYLVWSLLQGTVELFFSSQSHRGMSLDDIITIPYIPLAQFWFLYALLLMYIIFAVLSKSGRSAPILLAVTASILLFVPIPTEVIALLGFSTGFIFFVFGFLITRYIASWNSKIIPIPLTLIIFFVLILSIYVVFTYLVEPTRLTNGTHPFYFLYLATLGILFCIGLAQYLSVKKICMFLKVLGRYSIQIYLVHMLAGVAIRVILLSLFFIENPLLHMVLGVLGGLIVPIALYKISLWLNFPYLFELKKQPRT